MARYSKFKYGDGTHYGKSAVTEAGDLTWIFIVDWDGDGSYDGTNEAAWMKSFTMTRGRENYVNSEGSGFEHMGVDSASMVMDDPDRRYDPRNTGSDLSPDVYPGKKCQIAVYDNTTDPRTRYTRFTGYIDSISPTTGSNEVTIVCKGNMQTLADYELTFRAAHVNTTLSQCFVDLLDDAGYPSVDSIDGDTQPVRSFSVDRMSAAQVVGQLADAALGQFFVDVEGKAKFYSRSHNYSASVPTIDEDVILKDFIISQPWEGVFNKVDVICNKQVLEQPCVIFYLNDPLKLEVDDTVYIYPSFESANDISIGAAEAFENEDGSGANILASVQMTVFEIGPMGGRMGFYTSSAGYLTKLEIRGRKWTDVQETFSRDSVGSYGNRKFTLDSPFLQDRNYASAFMGILGLFLDDDRESLVIQIEGRPTVQFAYDLLTKITITSSTYDISDDYWIMGISEEWLSETGQLVKTTFYFSKIINDATSITPAMDIFDMSLELPAPLGLDNPAGDPDTQEAVSGTTPGGVLGSFVKALYLMADGAEAAPSWTDLIVTFNTEIFDPESIFVAPGNTITVQTSGRYIIFLNGYSQSNYPASDADSGALAVYSQFVAYKNSAMIDQNYSTAAFARAIKGIGGTYWQARGHHTQTIVCDFEAGDILTIHLNHSRYSSSEVSREWKVGLVMYKIAEVS